ncbi:hypothetical protein ACWCQB_14690 [Streptomyces hirsutus]
MPPSSVHRITKYDPADRDEHGRYTGTEDTVSDHGAVAGVELGHGLLRRHAELLSLFW